MKFKLEVTQSYALEGRRKLIWKGVLESSVIYVLYFFAGNLFHIAYNVYVLKMTQFVFSQN